jgi:serine/threonine protein kinase
VSHDADQAGELHFLVMEFVAGESLDQRIAKTGPASIATACDWIRQAALGLDQAHQQGMVHRDIKPQNLMLTDGGVVKILDFGLSRVVQSELLRQAGSFNAAPSKTHAQMIVGTPDYIAPEQVSNSSSADGRADIYSLGCTFYYLLTGKPPFDKGSVAAKLHAHESQPLPRLAHARPDVPARVVEIIERMTAKSPAERFQSAGAVAEALANILERDEHLPPAVAKRLPTRRAMFAAGVAALIATGLGYSAYHQFASPPPIIKPAAQLLVMLPSQGLWYPDYQELVTAAERANVKLRFTNASDKPSETTFQSPPGVAIADLPLGPDVDAKNFDGIVFIGYSTNEFLPGQPAGDETARLIHDFQRQKKVIASLCAGQRALAQHGAFRGKKVTTCQSVSDDEIKYEGGTRTQNPVQVDGQVVTASEAKNAPEFIAEILKIVSP